MSQINASASKVKPLRPQVKVVDEHPLFASMLERLKNIRPADVIFVKKLGLALRKEGWQVHKYDTDHSLVEVMNRLKNCPEGMEILERLTNFTKDLDTPVNMPSPPYSNKMYTSTLQPRLDLGSGTKFRAIAAFLHKRVGGSRDRYYDGPSLILIDKEAHPVQIETCLCCDPFNCPKNLHKVTLDLDQNFPQCPPYFTRMSFNFLPNISPARITDYLSVRGIHCVPDHGWLAKIDAARLTDDTRWQVSYTDSTHSGPKLENDIPGGTDVLFKDVDSIYYNYILSGYTLRSLTLELVPGDMQYERTHVHRNPAARLVPPFRGKLDGRELMIDTAQGYVMYEGESYKIKHQNPPFKFRAAFEVIGDNFFTIQVNFMEDFCTPDTWVSHMGTPVEKLKIFIKNSDNTENSLNLKFQFNPLTHTLADALKTYPVHCDGVMCWSGGKANALKPLETIDINQASFLDIASKLESSKQLKLKTNTTLGSQIQEFFVVYGDDAVHLLYKCDRPDKHTPNSTSRAVNCITQNMTQVVLLDTLIDREKLSREGSRTRVVYDHFYGGNVSDEIRVRDLLRGEASLTAGRNPPASPLPSTGEEREVPCTGAATMDVIHAGRELASNPSLSLHGS